MNNEEINVDEVIRQYNELLVTIDSKIRTFNLDEDIFDLTGASQYVNEIVVDYEKYRKIVKAITDNAEKFGLSNLDVKSLKNEVTFYGDKIVTIKKKILYIYNLSIRILNDRKQRIKDKFTTFPEDGAKLIEELEKENFPSRYQKGIDSFQDSLSGADFSKVRDFNKLLSLIEEKLGNRLVFIDEESFIMDERIKYVDELIKKYTESGRPLKKSIMMEIDIMRERLSLLRYQETDLQVKINELVVKLNNAVYGKKRTSSTEYTMLINSLESFASELNGFNNLLLNTKSAFNKKVYDARMKSFMTRYDYFVNLINNGISTPIRENQEQMNAIKNMMDKVTDLIEKLKSHQKENTSQSENGNTDNKSKENEQGSHEENDDTFSNDVAEEANRLIADMEKFAIELDEFYENFNLGKSKLSNVDMTNKIRSFIMRLGAFNARVNDLPDAIKNTEEYKSVFLDKLELLRKKVEKNKFLLIQQNANDNTSSRENDSEPFEVKDVREPKKINKYYNKPVLIASALASLALLNTTIGTFLIPALIVGNIALIYKYPIMDKINDILGKSIGAKKDKKTGKWRNAAGLVIDKIKAIPGILKSIAVSGFGLPKITKKLVAKVKEIANMTPSDEYIQGMKERNQEVIRRETKKLCIRYIKSGLSFEEFCKKEMVPDSMVEKMAEYIQELSNDNVKGRSR